MNDVRELQFEATPGTGHVSALLLQPATTRALLVLAHGAGAGMRHSFMEAVASRLAARQIATFRYQFPYMEEGRKRPDHAARLELTARNAVARARESAPGLPLFAGGKSMGGRITSQTAAKEPLDGVRGLVFFGFPLHAPGRDGSKRGEHLASVLQPLLFLQGTRDALANLDLLRPVLAPLGARATLHLVEGGDHSFKVPKRSGRTHEQVLDELAEVTAQWIGER